MKLPKNVKVFSGGHRFSGSSDKNELPEHVLENIKKVEDAHDDQSSDISIGKKPGKLSSTIKEAEKKLAEEKKEPVKLENSQIKPHFDSSKKPENPGAQGQ